MIRRTEHVGSHRIRTLEHRPETTLLCQVVQEYWPEFQAELANHGRFLPANVTKEFDEYLKCGRLEYVFLKCINSTGESGPFLSVFTKKGNKTAFTFIYI